jgi:hypothetical protein
MYARSDREQALIAKIRDLAEERVAEVEDFVDFLRSRDEQRRPVEAAERLSEPSLAAVWDNPEDDVYNAYDARFDNQIKLPLRRPGSVAEMNEIYRQFVKPVEHEHEGEYVLVRPTGEMIFGPSMDKVVEAAHHLRSDGNCIFKVGTINAVDIL